VTFYGTVRPPGAGQKVYLQQLVAGKWTTRATATIKQQVLPDDRATVGYVVKIRLDTRGTFSFRVLKPATATLAAGWSATTTVKVT
jgi:hypothetical protein